MEGGAALTQVNNDRQTRILAPSAGTPEQLVAGTTLSFT